jgi:glyoxylase-like metal-dependent hydrolase (beta-lactamase superfamily II)
MKIIPLGEGTFTIDKTKVFVPFQIDKDNLQNRTVGSLLVEIQPFAIVTSKDLLLIDTGLGFTKNNKLQIYENLEANNLNYLQVTKVLLSHLHKDHAGGVSTKDKLGHYSLAFPNANYYIQKKEVDYAYEVGFPSYMVEEIGILVDHPKVVLLDGSGDIDGYIHYEISGGHSPYHQAFWIHENGETVFFGGDDAPQLQQMKSKFVAKYDFDGKKSMQLRQQWWQQGHEQKWKFLFYHDIKTPVYTTSF